VWIQLVLIAAVVALGAFVMRRTGADSHLALRRLGFLLFALVAVLSILFPRWLTFVANLIGVGRGTDLLLYTLVIVFLAFVLTQFRRNVRQQQQITLLSRRLALLDAKASERETDVGAQSSSPVRDPSARPDQSED
jgi:small membrane protein